jgi:hypothetical protein
LKFKLLSTLVFSVEEKSLKKKLEFGAHLLKILKKASQFFLYEKSTESAEEKGRI